MSQQRASTASVDRIIFNHVITDNEMVYALPLVRNSGLTQMTPCAPVSGQMLPGHLRLQRGDLSQKASSASRTLTASSSKTIFDSLLIKIKKVNQITSVAENVQGRVHRDCAGFTVIQ